MPAKKPVDLQVEEPFFTERNIGIISIVMSVIGGLLVFVIYISSAPPTSPGSAAPIALSAANHNLLSLTMIIALAPYAVFAWYRNRRIDRVEQRFAEFLRDLAEYWKSGISMTTAIRTLSKGEYGAMTEDVQKMNAQISWGVAFNKVLHQMAFRIKTKLVLRSVSLIEEANRAGGKISDVLETAAKDASEIKWMQSERKRGVSMYVIVIYIAFLVYLAVIAIIVALFLPAIVGSSQGMEEAEDDPAAAGQGGSSGQAGGMGGGFGGMSTKKISKSKLTFIFYSSILVQSVGNGLMAGLMGEGKISAGLRHVVVMVILGWATFSLMEARIGIGFS